MSKEKQIDNCCYDCIHYLACLKNGEYLPSPCSLYDDKAGYRKQSEVIDEFVEMLKKEMNNLSRIEYHCDPYFLVSKDFVDRIAAKMKGGAE